MEKHRLALELRQRQSCSGILAQHIIDALSDDELIESYITCTDCGEKLVPLQVLESAIRLINSVDEFFEVCENFARARNFMIVEAMRKKNSRAIKVRRRR